MTFQQDAIPGINDYIGEGYFNGISSGAKRYLAGKTGLRGVMIDPDGGDYYFSEIFASINPSKVKGCR